MKPLALWFFALLFLLVAAMPAARAQGGMVKRGSHQAILVPEGAALVRLEIDPELVEIRSTRSHRVIVESTISMSGSMALLDYAISVGRYEMEASLEGNVLVVRPKPFKQDIIIRGEVIRESVRYVVYIPEAMEQNHAHVPLL